MSQYADFDFALGEVLNNPAVRGLTEPADVSYVSTQLHVTAGKLGAVIVFRPYYVAAKFLEQKRSQQSLTEGGGAKFTNLATPIASLFRQQSSIDEMLGLDVPPGMESLDPDCDPCKASLLSARRRSTAVSTTARP